MFIYNIYFKKNLKKNLLNLHDILKNGYNKTNNEKNVYKLGKKLLNDNNQIYYNHTES